MSAVMIIPLTVSDDVIRRLDGLRLLRDRPRSELLCEAIEQYLDRQSPSELRDALGLWSDGGEDSLAYERSLREEW